MPENVDVAGREVEERWATTRAGKRSRKLARSAS